MRKASIVIIAAAGLLAAGCQPDPGPRTAYDFDGDGQADLVWTAGGTWYRGFPGSEQLIYQGAMDEQPVPADYDGDGRADIMSLTPDGQWLRADHSVFTRFGPPVGMTVYRSHPFPVPANYHGDARAEPAWYDDGTGIWYVQGVYPIKFGDGPSDPTAPPPNTSYGIARLDQDIPVPADYDGDRLTDLAVFSVRTNEWIVRHSTDGSVHRDMVGPANRFPKFPVPGDYDGVGRAQRAFVDAAGWHIEGHDAPIPYPGALRQGVFATEHPVPGDYDGDGRLDLAFWQAPYNGPSEWRFAGSTNVARWTSPPHGLPIAIPAWIRPNIARLTYLALVWCEDLPAGDPACYRNAPPLSTS